MLESRVQVAPGGVLFWFLLYITALLVDLKKTNHTLGFSVFPIDGLMAMAGALCRPRNSSKQMSYKF